MANSITLWSLLNASALLLAFVFVFRSFRVISELHQAHLHEKKNNWKFLYYSVIGFAFAFAAMLILAIIRQPSIEMTLAVFIMLGGSVFMYKSIFTGYVSDKSFSEADYARGFLSDVFQEMGNLMIVADTQGRITMINKTTEEMLGMPERDIIGRKVEEFFLQEVLTEIGGMRENGLLLPGLRELPVQLTVNHFNTESRNCCVIVAQDISNLKNQERKLKEYLQRIERSNKDLEQFSYVAAHDLKAPLRAIHNLAVFIEEDLGSLPPSVKQNMDLLKGRIHRMEGLVNGILEYAKSGKKAVSPEITDVGVLVNDIVDNLGLRNQHEVEIQEGLPVILTQRILLEQVMSNLLSNAHKYNDNPHPKIEIQSKELEKEFEFSVTDNGPGIPLESQNKVFQIFQTVQARDTYESTGIGLSIVKKIIEEKGCKIELQSSPGEGCTFKFTWPKLMV